MLNSNEQGLTMMIETDITEKGGHPIQLHTERITVSNW